MFALLAVSLQTQKQQFLHFCSKLVFLLMVSKGGGNSGKSEGKEETEENPISFFLLGHLAKENTKKENATKVCSCDVVDKTFALSKHQQHCCTQNSQKSLTRKHQR